eukprot:755393-Hanusia_phi.AAC.6
MEEEELLTRPGDDNLAVKLLYRTVAPTLCESSKPRSRHPHNGSPTWRLCRWVKERSGSGSRQRGAEGGKVEARGVGRGVEKAEQVTRCERVGGSRWRDCWVMEGREERWREGREGGGREKSLNASRISCKRTESAGCSGAGSGLASSPTACRWETAGVDRG